MQCLGFANIRSPLLGTTFLLSLFLALLTPLTGFAADESFYGRSIVVSMPTAPNDALKPALEQLQSTLQRMTNQSFTLAVDLIPQEKLATPPASGEPAVILATTDSPLVPDAMRKRFVGIDSARAVLVKSSEDGNRLWIVAPTQAGLEQGVYVYLEELGCRWFITGKPWDIVPQKTDIRVKLDRFAENGSTAWPAIEIDRPTYSQKLTAFGPNNERKNRLGSNDLSEQVYARGEVDMLLNARAGQQQFIIKLRVQRADNAASTAPGPVVQLRAVDGKSSEEIVPRADFEWEELKFKIPRVGMYQLHISGASLTGIQTPPRYAVVFTRYQGQVLDAWKSRLYFFVPKGLFRVAIYTHSQQPVTIYDPEGNPIKLSQTNRLVTFDVPKGMDGRAWAITDETSAQDIELINIPPYLAFFPDGLLMPDNTDRRSIKRE